MRALPVAKLHLVDEDAVGDAWWKLSSQPELLQQLMVQADHGDSNEPGCDQFLVKKNTSSFMETSSRPASATLLSTSPLISSETL